MSKENELADRLKLALESSELSQKELADKLRTSQPMISHWISGRKTISSEKLLQIARELNVDPEWLRNGVGRIPDSIMKKAKQEASWIFRPQHPDGGRDYGNANVWTIPWRLENLVRESTQNSLDARLNQDAPVEVEFRVIQLGGEELALFLKAINWENNGSSLGLFDHISASSQTTQKLSLSLNAGLNKFEKSREIFLLRIDDRNTTGLIGPEYETGNFAALVRNNLDTSKLSEISGGAYGLGKAVFWRASRISTVFFCSYLSELPDEGDGTRLIGKTDLPWHSVNGSKFAGPGWFGKEHSRKGGVATHSLSIDPVLADSLYLSRGSDDPGTSILVVGFYDPSSEEAIDLQTVSTNIQRLAAINFWPAIAMNKLEVKVSTWNGREQLGEFPVEPDRLQSEYIDALQKFQNNELSVHLENEGDVVSKRITLNIPKRRVEPKHSSSEHEAILLVRRDDEFSAEFANEVVFYRSQGMIVSRRSFPTIGAGSHPYRAIVITGEAAGDLDADRHGELFLRAAEPPAHNRWVLTPEIKDAYVLGGGAALQSFYERVRETIHEIVQPFYKDLDQGPYLLAELLRVVDQTRIKSRSQPKLVINQKKSRIEEDRSWKIVADIHLPSDRNWRVAPILRFAAETGRGRRVDWRINPISGCTVDNGYLVINKGVRKARFVGISDPSTHPTSVKDTAVEVSIHTVKKE